MSEIQLSKIAISQISDQALSKAVVKVNEDFLGGRVSKTDLASWLILTQINSLNDASIAEIQKIHFDQVVYMDGLIKKLKSSGRHELTSDELEVLHKSPSRTPKNRRKLTEVSQSNLKDEVKSNGDNSI